MTMAQRSAGEVAAILADHGGGVTTAYVRCVYCDASIKRDAKGCSDEQMAATFGLAGWRFAKYGSWLCPEHARLPDLVAADRTPDLTLLVPSWTLSCTICHVELSVAARAFDTIAKAAVFAASFGWRSRVETDADRPVLLCPEHAIAVTGDEDPPSAQA